MKVQPHELIVITACAIVYAGDDWTPADIEPYRDPVNCRAAPPVTERVSFLCLAAETRKRSGMSYVLAIEDMFADLTLVSVAQGIQI